MQAQKGLFAQLERAIEWVAGVDSSLDQGKTNPPFRISWFLVSTWGLQNGHKKAQIEPFIPS